MPTSRFIQRFGDKITGVWSGFDRLILRGSLGAIVNPAGMKNLLWRRQIRLSQFGSWAQGLTEQLKQACCQAANDPNRPVIYVPSSDTDKDDLARRIAARDGITKGLVVILTCVEPCMSFDVYRNKNEKKLELIYRPRKCLALYQYSIDAEFGWMNARIQSWLPFPIQICLNGREWLAQMLDHNKIRYRRDDNCLTWIAGIDKAQRLMNRQLRISWPKALARIARQLHPMHGRRFREFCASY